MHTTPTTDPGEMARFEKLADAWWDSTGPFWPLHRLNELRVKYLRDRLADRFGGVQGASKPLKGLDILDLGCGGGLLSEALAELGASVHGVDVVAKNIRVANHHALTRGLDIRYECVAVEELTTRDERYDAVLNMEVVEHVAELPLFMAACSTLVRPGGVMVIATINRTAASFLGAIVAAEYLLRWLPRGTHCWHKFPKPSELERLLKDNALQIVERVGVRMTPFGRQFRLSRYLGINYMLLAEKAAHRVSVAVDSS
jgi:2-polyprenyl-6-hydroxyphenyl methylase/3-demethylubiquinone-9 3-methyltransferase